MKSELLKIRYKETAAKIQNTKIDAIRMKDIVKKGARVHNNGFIGIAGALGDVPDNELLAKAEENLSIQIPYPYEIETSHKDHRTLNANPMHSKELFEHAENILTTLSTEFEDFDFSEKIATSEFEYHYTNSNGLDLKYEDAYFELGLVLKEKSSANLFDGFLMYKGRNFNAEKFISFNRECLNAYRNSVDLPEESKMPVFFLEFSEMIGMLNRSFNGEKYATGSSLFSGKLGEQLFNSKINISQNFDSETVFRPFFDHEGCHLPNDHVPMIESGKFVNVFTDKRTATNFNLPHTGAASGEYDGTPNLAMTTLHFKTDSESIPAALGNQKAIFVVVAAGGDFTPDGSYASPVQVSFLFDGEKFIGKLPEFQIRGHLNSLLGDDYIGTFESPLYLGDHITLQGFYMDVVK